MARSKGSKIELTAYDDLFETDESRAEAALSKIRDIPISEIDDFPDHAGLFGAGNKEEEDSDEEVLELEKQEDPGPGFRGRKS